MNSSLNNLWARRAKCRQRTESAVLFENILWRYLAFLLYRPQLPYLFQDSVLISPAHHRLDICINLVGMQFMDEKLLARMRRLILAKHYSHRTAKPMFSERGGLFCFMIDRIR